MEKIVYKYLNRLNKIQKEILGDNGTIKNEVKFKNELNDIALNYVDEMKTKIQEGYYPKNISYKNELVNLKILWSLFDDFGFEYIDILFNEFSGKNWKANSKIRLFMMFVKSVGEIIYLLEGGYASCALGRIRYLYEIGVYLEILNKNSQDLSRKFLQFSNINRIKIVNQLKDYRLKKKMIKDLKKFKNYMDMWETYGWAKDILPNEKITFRKLAEITTLREYYAIYIFSSLSIHADVYGSANSIDLYTGENDRTWITTPSIMGTDIVISNLLLFIFKISTEYFTVENEVINVFVLLVIRKVYFFMQDVYKIKNNKL